MWKGGKNWLDRMNGRWKKIDKFIKGKCRAWWKGMELSVDWNEMKVE